MNFFANSARPDYALTTDIHLSDKKIDVLQAANRRAASHAREFTSADVTALRVEDDVAVNFCRRYAVVGAAQFSVEEIARAYGVPPFMIGHNEKTTSWGLGRSGHGHWFCPFHASTAPEQIPNRDQSQDFRTAGRVAEFDTTDLEQADFQSLMTSLRVAVGRAGEPGIMRVNEARAALKLKKDLR